MSEAGVTILGAKQLSDLFDDLKKSQKRSVVISAWRKSSKPMLRTIKSNLIARTRAKRSGNLFKSLGVKDVRGQSILHLGARTFGIYKGYHSHLIESGTKERYYTTKTGVKKSTGKIKGRYWFRSGVESTTKETVDGFINNTIELTHALIKRYNAKRKT
ncbi:hypothetical protein ES705_35962 [subsurface metagenome]